MLRNSFYYHHVSQSFDHLGAAPSSFGTHQQALSGVFIDQVQHPHRPSVMCGPTHEVIAPDMVRPFWAQPNARSIVEPQPSSWLLFLWNLQPFPPPDTFLPVLANSRTCPLERRLALASAICVTRSGTA